MALSAKQRRLLEDALCDRGEGKAIADEIDASISGAGSVDGQLLVGQTAGPPLFKTVSGDLTLGSDGAAAIKSSVKTQTVFIPIEDLAADGDIAARTVFVRSGGCTLTSVGLVAQGTFAGVDNSNTIVADLKDGDGNTICTQTLDDGTAGVIPVDNGLNDLGALDATNKVLQDNELVTIDITCGTSADPPAMLLRIEFIPS